MHGKLNLLYGHLDGRIQQKKESDSLSRFIENVTVMETTDNVTPKSLFYWIYGRNANGPDDKKILLNMQHTLNIPDVFKETCMFVVAFHSWLESGWHDEENETYYFWSIKLPAWDSQTIVCLHKRYFHETIKTVIPGNKREHFESPLNVKYKYIKNWLNIKR